MERGRTRRRLWALLGLLCVLVPGTFLARPPTLTPDSEPVRFLDRNGVLLAERPMPDGRRGDPIQEIPRNVELAFLAAEDHRFHRHPGLDPVAIARAAVANLRGGAVVQGGSTITQQLARSLEPRPPGLPGKALEAWRAIHLELHLSKEEILRQYLNRVYLGAHSWGVEAAAHTYLDKPAGALSAAEAALLAALPPRPSVLDPWKNPAGALTARNRVLERMAALGWMDQDAAALAKDEPLGLQRACPWYNAPHLVRRLPPSPGITRTTLDLGIQREAVSAVEETINALRHRGVSQAAVLVADTATGEVLAYVGSAGWATEAGQVDGVMARRSPGSALKPFSYALALERGLGEGGITLASPLADLPGGWRTGRGTWMPSNYDDQFNGPVTARDALARSLNLPAIRTLEGVGVASLHRRLVELGVTTLEQRPAHYGLGLVLGDGEVKLDELVQAYLALANGARRSQLRYVMGPVEPEDPEEGRQVMDPRAAWLVLHALSDRGARAASFGVDSALDLPFPAAAKTGTSVGWRDNIAVGVTPEVTVGVWVGNFDASPMEDVTGATGAGPILNRVMTAAHSGAPRSFRRPEGLVEARVCSLSGLLPGPVCPNHRTEVFLAGTAPTSRCGWHQEIHVDDGGALATGCPGARRVTAIAWPPRYLAWATRSGALRWPEVDRSCEPRDESGPPEIASSGGSIAWPHDGATFYLDPRDSSEEQALSLQAAAPPGAESARWTVNGEEIGRRPPWAPLRWVPEPGAHRLGLELDGHPAGEITITISTSEDRP